MTIQRALRTVGLVVYFPTFAFAQLLGGDPHFPVLNQMRWEMNIDEIREVCGNNWAIAGKNDSLLTYNAVFFSAASRVRIQIEPKSGQPRMISIGFEKPRGDLRDTLISHLTSRTGKAAMITIKEKSAIVFTVKMETASWRYGNDLVSVVAAMRGGELFGLTVLLRAATVGAK
jgi:hypothetical protein